MGESYLRRDNRARKSLQLALARLATSQHGPFHRDQAIALGFEEHQVDYAVNIRRFHPVYPEVYVLGNRKLFELGSLSAAGLACGEGACLG
jgi:hypothetical protein